MASNVAIFAPSYPRVVISILASRSSTTTFPLHLLFGRASRSTTTTFPLSSTFGRSIKVRRGCMGLDGRKLEAEITVLLASIENRQYAHILILLVRRMMRECNFWI